MKWASLLSLFVVSLFLLCVHDTRAQGRFDVTVQVVNAGVPVPGANIKIVNSTGNRNESFSGVSDGNGKATIHVETIFGGTFQVLAEKALYHPGDAKFTAGGDSRDKDKNIEIELTEDSLAIEITVHVTDQATSAAVVGVSVTLTGRLTNTAYETATTDQNGDARLYLVNNTGSFTISTSSNNFERYEGPIVVERGQRQQTIPVALKKKVVKGRQNATFFAIVKTKDEDGKLVPLPGALITLVDQRITAITDARGTAELHAEAGVGDEVVMTASKDGYSNQRKVASMTFETVGAAGGVVSVSGGAEFELDKYPRPGVELIVEVLDSKTNKPIQNAAVTVHPSASELSDRKGSTSESGAVSFLNDAAIPVDKALKGVRVMVGKAGYKEKWSDVTPDLLTAGRRRFTVYLDATTDQDSEYKIVTTVTVSPGAWVSTGVKLTKGQGFKVVATGSIKAREYPFTEIGPGGNGYYSLKGLIKDPAGANNQFIVLGASGSDAARFDGELQLAASRSNYYAEKPAHPEDQLYQGAYTVTIYVAGGATAGLTGDRAIENDRHERRGNRGSHIRFTAKNAR